MRSKVKNLRLTEREYKLVHEGLYLASQWEESIADAYTLPSLPLARWDRLMRRRAAKSLRASERYLRLRGQLIEKVVKT